MAKGIESQCLQDFSFGVQKLTPLLLFPTFCLHFSFSKITMSALIDFSKTSLYLAIAHIFFNPIFWNTVARAGKLYNQIMKLTRY